jgi:TfoX/Sxy family transcriptional regulator of competence genes
VAYDEDLAIRIRELLGERENVVERRMFGGLAFLVDGRIALAASHDGGVLLRADPEEAGRLLEDPGVSRFVMRGRELDGWLRVRPDALGTRAELAAWVARALREV